MNPSAAQGWNDYAFISQSPLGLPLLAGAAVLIAVFATFSIVAYVRAGRRYWPLAVLHLASAVAVIVVLFQPAIDLRAVTRVPGRVALVIDDSQSMLQRDGGAATRAERVQAWLSERAAALDALKSRYPLELYSLSGPGRSDKSDATASPLIDAVQRPLETHDAARPVSAVVLVSDGADTEALGAAADAEARAALISRLRSKGVPISTVVVGTGGAPDVFIDEVVQDPIAFVRNTVKIEVSLGARGFDSINVPVILKRDGSLVSQQTATLGGGARGKVGFEVVPDEVGEFVFTVEVPAQAGETVLENNKRELIVRVVRDKIRVLLVAGRPSWDERFLRRTLKLSPNVDLISFFILRTPSDFQLVPQNESSLIPFPTHELFGTELHTFDIVVLQNFDYRPYNMQYLLKNLREHVQKGGALVMFGGEASFGGGAYGQTPLADVLPLEMSQGELDYREFTPTLTAAGQKHPVLRLSAGTVARDKTLSALPKLAGIMRTDGLAPGASALLVHPELKTASGEPMPVVAVREVGRGRTMAVTTDSVWRWSFTDRMRGETGAAYERFIGQMFRWLMRDPDASRLRLTSHRDRVKVGEPIDFSVRVLSREYQPQKGVQVSLAVTGSAGVVEDGASGEGTPKALAGAALVQLSAVTGDDGVASFSHTPAAGGVVRAVAEATLDDEPVSASLLVYSDAADKERAALGVRADLMRELADATGGTAQTLERADPAAWPKAELETVSVDRHEEVPLWNTWPALALVMLSLSAEWLLRRRWGFV